jgi:putative tryptophan/tyrosine transport system substrate-binding protein
MRRRQFIAGLGSATVWPLATWAQQPGRMRRIGVLIGFDENDPNGKARFSAFMRGLSDLGWTEGRNMQVDVRWEADDVDRMRSFAKELVGLRPDVMLGSTTALMSVLQRETRTIPIAFASVADPVGSGLVAALNQPGGNITGFGLMEASIGGKWLELLSGIAPGLKRAAMMFNPDTAPGSVYVPSFETAARSLKVVPVIAPVHSDVEIETAIIALGREPRGGLVVKPDAFMFAHRAPIILAAARSNVSAVYPNPEYARDGGLLSYGVDQVDSFRGAAPYVDRILRGARPGDLPVQFPTKFEMVVNLKTAKALGITIPETLLATADEVIQ